MSELSSRVEVLENRMTQASRIILDMTKSTPVLPADKLMSASPSTWDLIQFHILVSFEFLIAVNGVSSSETIAGA